MISTNKISYTHQPASISATPRAIKSHNLQFWQSRLNIFFHPTSPSILNVVLICTIRWRISTSFQLDTSRDLSSPCVCFFITTMTTNEDMLIAYL